mmetsp:Transcript_55961/g.92955  ORF Transcript_55961/g.92955 Transcript_55961/m.92955 type:complete len:115 (-) Transcript_55961:50-394(-)
MKLCGLLPFTVTAGATEEVMATRATPATPTVTVIAGREGRTVGNSTNRARGAKMAQCTLRTANIKQQQKKGSMRHDPTNNPNTNTVHHCGCHHICRIRGLAREGRFKMLSQLIP